MKYLLSSTATQSIAPLWARPDIGVLLSPGSSKPVLVERAGLWAADNGCFSQGDSFNLDLYLGWLWRMRPMRGSCLFATAPDVVGNAIATWDRSRAVLPEIRRMGYPAALVAQDGFEDMKPAWDSFDTLFVGGTTAWKLSETAVEIVGQARQEGKTIHMGRVNSRRRLKIAQIIGCDSVDGTFVAFGPDKNAALLSGWLDELRNNPPLQMEETT